MPPTRTIIRFVRWPVSSRARPLVVATKVGPSGPWIALVDYRLEASEQLAHHVITLELGRLKQKGIFPSEMSTRALSVEYYAAALRGAEHLTRLLLAELERRKESPAQCCHS